MIRWFLRRIRREACRQLVVELFQYNRKDGCWDPIGSIDAAGLDATIDTISKGKLAPRSVQESKILFKKGRRKWLLSSRS